MTENQKDWAPLEVLEYTLRVSGDALIYGDFAAFASIFDFPHTITTFEGSRVLRTQDDLRETFETVRNHFANNQITSIVRECIEASFDDEGQIAATHTTRLLAREQQVGETSIAYSILRLKGTLWLGTSSQYAVADKDLSCALVVTSGAALNPNMTAALNTHGAAQKN